MVQVAAGLRQGFLEIGDPKGVQAQLGRFDYASATEVASGDPVLDSLVSTRLSQRMIGLFGYTDFSRSFDGLRLDVDGPVLHVTRLAARPTQGGFEPHFAVGMDRVFLGNLSATLKKSEVLPASTAQMFWTRYDDTRNVPFVDNRPPALRGTVAGQGGIHLDTLGLHFVSRLGQNGDVLLWYATSREAGAA